MDHVVAVQIAAVSVGATLVAVAAAAAFATPTAGAASVACMTSGHHRREGDDERRCKEPSSEHDPGMVDKIAKKLDCATCVPVAAQRY
jgi:hypothetical protein